MKKLFAMLLVGALVSMGCSSSTTTGTKHGGATEARTSTQISGTDTHSTSPARPDTAGAGRTGTDTKPATGTPTSKNGGTTEVKKTTEAGGKATSKVESTKKSGS